MDTPQVKKTRKARQAQVWAIRMAEELGAYLIRENISLPYELKNYPIVVQGQAIRHCQEVNLAKKQLDALHRQQGKAPLGVNWVMKYRLIDPARQPGDLDDYRPRASLYLDYARGRTVHNNIELEQTVNEFLESLRAQPEPARGSVLEAHSPLPGKVDPQEALINKMYGLGD